MAPTRDHRLARKDHRRERHERRDAVCVWPGLPPRRGFRQGRGRTRRGGPVLPDPAAHHRAPGRGRRRAHGSAVRDQEQGGHELVQG